MGWVGAASPAVSTSAISSEAQRGPAEPRLLSTEIETMTPGLSLSLSPPGSEQTSSIPPQLCVCSLDPRGRAWAACCAQQPLCWGATAESCDLGLLASTGPARPGPAAPSISVGSVAWGSRVSCSGGMALGFPAAVAGAQARAVPWFLPGGSRDAEQGRVLHHSTQEGAMYPKRCGPQAPAPPPHAHQVSSRTFHCSQDGSGLSTGV